VKNAARSAIPPPTGVEPALARLVEALARQAARDDYARQSGGDNNEASGDLRPIFERPAN